MSQPVIHEYDVVIIGGGLTGLRAALQVSRAGISCALVSKVHPLRSHSVSAQGGMNASLGNVPGPGGSRDSWEQHASDTVKGSDYLADQDAVVLMCREAAATIFEMEHMGTVWSRLDDGKIAQRPFGGAGFPRTCYAADRTGHNILHTLYEQVTAAKIPVFEEFFVTSLVTGSGRCTGCTAIEIMTGTVHGFASKAVLMATGGFGRIFSRSTNAIINTGDGPALAIRAGAPLKDMEFVQFHPTTLMGTNILISEAARGEGGFLFNNVGERFMARYAPQSLDLAPRDIVARAIEQEIRAGRGCEGGCVYLDIRHLGAERIQERLPGIRQIAMDFAGVDPVSDPIPIQPGQHYSMGGIAVGPDGKSGLAGLYAAGECACVSVHGANRLGGNSLLETVVFGRLVADTMIRDVPHCPARILHLSGQRCGRWMRKSRLSWPVPVESPCSLSLNPLKGSCSPVSGSSGKVRPWSRALPESGNSEKRFEQRLARRQGEGGKPGCSYAVLSWTTCSRSLRRWPWERSPGRRAADRTPGLTILHGMISISCTIPSQGWKMTVSRLRVRR